MKIKQTNKYILAQVEWQDRADQIVPGSGHWRLARHLRPHRLHPTTLGGLRDAQRWRYQQRRTYEQRTICHFVDQKDWRACIRPARGHCGAQAKDDHDHLCRAHDQTLSNDEDTNRLNERTHFLNLCNNKKNTTHLFIFIYFIEKKINQ